MEYIERLGLGEIGYFEDDLADLPAASGVTDGAFAVVLTDATEANRGIYQEQSDAWVKTADLPPSYQAAADILDARDDAQAAAASAGISEVNAVIARGASETARDQAVAAASLAGTTIYDDTAAGIAATSDTEYFLAYQGPGLGRYLNDSGVALLQQWYSRVFFDDFGAFDGFPGSLPSGMVLRTWREGFTYQTVSADEHFTTTGGLNVQVVADGATKIYATAFGIDPTEGVDNDAEWVAMWSAIADMAASGPAPTVKLPAGHIDVTTPVTIPSGVTVIGQGGTFAGAAYTSVFGTKIMMHSTDAIFETGGVIGGARGSVNVHLISFTLTRHETYRTSSGTTGLINGYGATRWIIDRVHISSGYTPALHWIEPWDCHILQGTEIIQSGQPDGLAALTLIESGGTPENGNSSRISCRIEDTTGPMIYVSGNHVNLFNGKWHGPANTGGAGLIQVPAVKIEADHSAVMLNQIVNFFAVDTASKISTIVEIQSYGVEFQANQFRRNFEAPHLIKITGDDVFSGRHVITGNGLDDSGVSPEAAIVDARTTNGVPIILGPEELFYFTPSADLNVPRANKLARIAAGGTSFYTRTPGYFEQDDAANGPALHVRYSEGSGNNVWNIAALIQNYDYRGRALIVDNVRNSGTSDVAQIRSARAFGGTSSLLRGLVGTTASNTGEVSTGGTEVFDIDHSGYYYVQGAKVVGERQAAIADVPTGGSATAADNAAAINAILAALRAHGKIAT